MRAAHSQIFVFSLPKSNQHKHSCTLLPVKQLYCKNRNKEIFVTQGYIGSLVEISVSKLHMCFTTGMHFPLFTGSQVKHVDSLLHIWDYSDSLLNKLHKPQWQALHAHSRLQATALNKADSQLMYMV